MYICRTSLYICCCLFELSITVYTWAVDASVYVSIYVYMSSIQPYVGKLDNTYGGTSSVGNFTRTKKIAHDATETTHPNLRHSHGSN